MAVQTVTEFQLLIGGEWVASSSGQMDRGPQPGHRRGRRSRRQGHRRGRRSRRARRSRGLRRRAAGAASGLPERVAILNKLADLIEADMETWWRSRSPRPVRPQVPARQRHARSRPTTCASSRPPMRHLEGKAAGEYSTDHTSMVRREPIGVVRPGRALELPVHDGHLEDRPGARGRQLGRPQARQRRPR